MLNKTTIQNIRALVALAQIPKEKCEGARTIAKKINAPQNYLSKQLHNLSIHGLVISQKGLKGGFRLGKGAENITLYEVAESTEDVSSWKECAFGFETCSSFSPCPLHNRWKSVRESFLEFLQKTTVADLIQDKEVSLITKAG